MLRKGWVRRGELDGIPFGILIEINVFQQKSKGIKSIKCALQH